MPVEFKVDAANRVVFTKYSGTIDMPLVEDYARRLKADPDFQPEFSDLCDLVDVKLMTLTLNDFMYIADNVDPFSRQTRRAFVVKENMSFVGSELYRNLRNREHTEVFTSMDDARRWLGLG